MVFRNGCDEFLMDCLFVVGVIEVWGYECFLLVVEVLLLGKEKEFYVVIVKFEEKYKNLFVELVYEYFDKYEVDVWLEEIFVVEVEICKKILFIVVLY